MKVLVTGGAGFIGSHVVEELLNFKYKVIIVDNLATGHTSNFPMEAKFYQMDINDPKLENLFKNERPDYVIHLAAQASVAESMKDPYLDYNTNIAGTVNILLLSNKYNVKKVLFSSTAAVYGEPTFLPIDENHSINPLSFYSLSKYTAENYIKLFGTHNELNYSILRFSNVYGPRQNSDGESGVISTFISRLLDHQRVNIFDGSQTRDFIYVKDVAEACRLAMEGKHNGVFNISSCTETVINDLYHKLSEVSEVDIIPNYKSKRIGEIEKSILDNRKACREFDWGLKYTLSDGLEETLHYYSNLIGYKGQILESYQDK